MIIPDFDQDSLATLIILALATARLTLLVSRDSITEPIRQRIYMHSPPGDEPRKGWFHQRYHRLPKEDRALLVDAAWPESHWYYDDKREPRGTGFFGELVSCPDCSGVWVGAFVAAAWFAAGSIVLAPASALAFAQVASLVARRGGY